MIPTPKKPELEEMWIWGIVLTSVWRLQNRGTASFLAMHYNASTLDAGVCERQHICVT